MAEDPCASIVKFCAHSNSQEELLRRLPLTEKSDLRLHDDSLDTGDTPPEVECSGILIVSPPESEGTPQEDFKNRVEEARPQLVSSEEQKTMMAAGRDNNEEEFVAGNDVSDSYGTVDLGKDSEKGFEKCAEGIRAVGSIRVSTWERAETRVLKVPNSSAEIVVKGPGESSELEKSVDLGKDPDVGFSREKRNSPPNSENEISGESPLKKLKLPEKNVPFYSPNVCGMENEEDATESVQIGEKNELPNSGINEEGNLGNGDTEVLESEFDSCVAIGRVDSMTVKDSEEAEEIDGIHSTSEGLKAKCDVPFSFCRQSTNTDSASEEPAKHVEIDREKGKIDEIQLDVIRKGKHVSSTSEGIERGRNLPLSLRVPANTYWESLSDVSNKEAVNTDGNSASGTSTEQWLKTTKKFLTMLSKGTDNCSANESILEVAERCGMAFPKPRWWHGPGGYGPGLS